MSSGESYIDSIRPEFISMAERTVKVNDAISALRKIISTGFFEFNEDFEDIPLCTQAANTNPKDPSEFSFFNLYANEQPILKERVVNLDPDALAALPDRAEYDIINDSYFKQGHTAFTITMNPPDVLGYDGKQLDLAGVEGVILDIEHYQNTLMREQPQD